MSTSLTPTDAFHHSQFVTGNLSKMPSSFADLQKEIEQRAQAIRGNDTTVVPGAVNGSRGALQELWEKK